MMQLLEAQLAKSKSDAALQRAQDCQSRMAGLRAVARDLRRKLASSDAELLIQAAARADLERQLAHREAASPKGHMRGESSPPPVGPQVPQPRAQEASGSEGETLGEVGPQSDSHPVALAPCGGVGTAQGFDARDEAQDVSPQWWSTARGGLLERRPCRPPLPKYPEYTRRYTDFFAIFVHMLLDIADLEADLKDMEWGDNVFEVSANLDAILGRTCGWLDDWPDEQFSGLLSAVPAASADEPPDGSAGGLQGVSTMQFNHPDSSAFEASRSNRHQLLHRIA